MAKDKKSQERKSIDALQNDDYDKESYDGSDKKQNKQGMFDKLAAGGTSDAKSSRKTNISSKGNKGDKGKKKKSVRRFFSRYKWYFMWSILSFLAGLIILALFDGGNDNEVYQLSEPMSLEESIDNVRSSQIDSLQAQFSQIKKNQDINDTEDPDGPKLSKNKKLIADAISDSSKELDPILKDSMNVHYDADKKDKDKVRDSIKKKVDDKVFDDDAIDNLIDGNSAGKELRQYGVKSGGTQPSIVGVDEKDNFVFLSITPYSVKDRTVSVVHIAKINDDKKVVDLHYVGYLQSYGHQRAQNITKAIKESLNKDTKADKDLDKSVESTLDKEKKENAEKAKKEKEDKEKKEKDDKDKKDKKDK